MMTRDEVIASEQGRVISEKVMPDQSEIVFRTQVGGMPATITYILENDKLLSGSYTFRRDISRKAFDFMRQDLVTQNGAPAFEKGDLVGWRLEKTEIALAHFADGTSYVAFWEKDYFRRMNKTAGMGDIPRF
ncbi:MAG: hypothetical protein ABSG63_07625 [Spirochaetia bacterium]|jgi:hypothetical protein